jgi:cyclase
VIIGDGGNVAVYSTSEGTILIDDKYERDYTDIMAKVKSVTSQPVKYVLNTHQHGDHTGGNAQMLGASVEIIAHRNARANMVAGKMPGVPRIAFSDETSVFLGGKEVRAHYFGRGHTNGDAVVYFPQDKTIHTGDLMAGNSPLIDYNGGGSLAEWAKTLDAAMKLDFDTVIPGHGPVTTKAGLTTYRNNVDKLKTEVTGLIRSGKTQDDLAKYMTANYGWAANSLQQQWSVPGMMKELK